MENARSILRLPGLCKRLGSPRSTAYRDIRSGLLTPPVRLGKRSSGWPDDEIAAIVDARIAGKSDEEIRELVKQLIAARTSGSRSNLRVMGASQG